MFSSLLTWWQWIIVGAIPLGVLSLYFLKLKRTPIEVPSTYLWHKSIEDLHVNSIWQRLRNNILLWLQLLLLLLAIIALLNPTFQGTKLVGSRFIFVLDNSASMQSRDVTLDGETVSRLEAGKQQVRALIESMPEGAVAMLISFADGAQVMQPFTDNPTDLLRAMEQIQPTDKPTSLTEALRVSSGLSNPTRTGSEEQDRIKASVMPAKLYVLSDGNFDVVDFALGALEPEYRKIGKGAARNIAITAFSVDKNVNDSTKIEAFASVDNFGPDEQSVVAELYLVGLPRPLDAVRVDIQPSRSQGISFPLARDFESGVLELQVRPESAAGDDLRIDDKAWVVVDNPHRARVLQVSATQNNELRFALSTRRFQDLISLKTVVLEEDPTYLESETYQLESRSGVYDLIVFDRCVPPDRPSPDGSTDEQETEMPLCNTMFIGTAPKLASWGWVAGEEWPPPLYLSQPKIIDTDRSHPIMQSVSLGNLLIVEGFGMAPPSGGRKLIDSNVSREADSALLTIGPREAFEDLILSFDLVNEDGYNTEWMLRQSFPVFVWNMVKYMGSPRDALSLASVSPGDPIELKIDSVESNEVTISTPGGETHTVARTPQQTFLFTRTDEVGIYDMRSDGKSVAKFAVNLFNPQESNIPPNDNLEFLYEPVPATEVTETVKQEWWKWLAGLALVVLLVEWFVYNRRVSL
ncbi:MAG: VWA domain-containing protein [Pirellulales bacterium]|nr:VWA domain-containing protein [Pirellulales bacterium]